MQPTPESTQQSVAQAEDKLARLGVQVDAMQAVLVRLLQDVVRAEHRLGSHQGTQLVQANEQLLLAALNSQANVEVAALSQPQTALAPALDTLTQLPNRSTLRERFTQALDHAQHHGGSLALMFLDLDNFKPLNDQYGHAFGDEMLRLVADRLRAQVRAVDTVSRHGGDEFLILLVDVKQPADVQHIAENLIQALSAPAEIAGQRVLISASIGVAFAEAGVDDLDTLTARADAAMYRSKRQRVGGLAFHGQVSLPVPAAAVSRPEGQPLRPLAHPSAPLYAEPQRLHAALCEANEKLLLATLSAQELQAAAERTQQRQSAFMLAVAAELRNPQAPIRIATSMLGRLKTDEPLLPLVQEVVQQQLAHMARLVGSLLDVSAAPEPAAQAPHTRVDMGALVKTVAAAQQAALAARGQHLQLQLDEALLQVWGNAAQLAQVLGNLLDNAHKHTHDGGHIGVQLARSEGGLTLSVQDDGIGISAAMLPFVFDPFVQDTAALGFNGVGLGIGLTVARALVQAHGGTLQAHSAGTRQGSRFVVSLPLAPDAAG